MFRMGAISAVPFRILCHMRIILPIILEAAAIMDVVPILAQTTNGRKYFLTSPSKCTQDARWKNIRRIFLNIPQKYCMAMACQFFAIVQSWKTSNSNALYNIPSILQLKTLEAQKEAILQRYICIKNFPCPHEWMRMSVLGRPRAARILTSSWLLSRHNSSVTLAEFSHTPKEIEQYYLP